MNKVKAYNNLSVAKEVFDKLDVIFWLDGGTCLGAFRENDFMDSDFDIDIGMYGEDDIRISEIMIELKDRGFSYFHLKEHPCGEGKQISCIKDGISLDVFVYYLRDDNRWRCMFDVTPLRTVRHFACVYPNYLFDKLGKIDFMDYGVEFNLPAPTEEYLRRQYGDWKEDKPKEKFQWQWDYKSMEKDFEIYKKDQGKRRWLLTDTINGEAAPGDFFVPIIKEGYKVYPITVNEERRVVDGHKRLAAYKQLGVPMVECICMNK